MNTLRIVSAVLAVAAGMVLVSGTLGLTSTTADRDVSIAVVEDDEALVGYEVEDHHDLNATEDHEVELVEIENRLSQEVEVTGIILDSEDNHVVGFDDIEEPRIGTGHKREITAELERCTPGSETEVFVTVTVAGDSVEATLFGDSETARRSFTVTCEEESAGPSETGGAGSDGPVQYTGNGGAKLTTESPREATVTFASESGGTDTATDTFEPDQNLKTQISGVRNGNGQNPIRCVAIDGNEYPDPDLEDPCGEG